MKTKTFNTKKLRYLSPDYASEPNRFIKEVVNGWDDWSVNFGFLFSYSMCPQLDRNRVFDYGFTYIHLAQMIEAAYTILKNRGWQPTSKEKLFQYSSAHQLYALLQRENINVQRVLSDFFGFMSLRQWYTFLDELLLSSDIKNKKQEDYAIEPEHLIAREFIILLPDALLQIHKENVTYFNSKLT